VKVRFVFGMLVLLLVFQAIGCTHVLKNARSDKDLKLLFPFFKDAKDAFEVIKHIVPAMPPNGGKVMADSLVCTSATMEIENPLDFNSPTVYGVRLHEQEIRFADVKGVYISKFRNAKMLIIDVGEKYDIGCWEVHEDGAAKDEADDKYPVKNPQNAVQNMEKLGAAIFYYSLHLPGSDAS
jgi:hypothetical protein